MKATELPEKMLRLLSPEDRKALRVQSFKDAIAKGEARSEKELHAQIRNLLSLRGIEFIESRMDRRTTQKKGVPDFLFAVLGWDGYANRIYACAIEVKLPGQHLREEQRAMRKALTNPPNHWTHRVIHSVSEMKAFLDGIVA